jgi:hypothetical protein
MIDTLPAELTPALLAFCRTISAQLPQFIASTPAADAVPAYCFENAANAVRRGGGHIAYGWAIWQTPGLYFEAEHHAVWCDTAGTLTDVSPQFKDYASILFLPDPQAVYMPAHPRENRFAPDGASAEAQAIVQLARQRSAVWNACRINGGDEFAFNDATNAQLEAIDTRIANIAQRARHLA